MKILIFGAGAIGSVFGGFLSRNHNVTLLGRSTYLANVRKKGLRVTGIWGNYLFRRLVCRLNFKELIQTHADFDLILVTVKSYDTASAAKQIKLMMGTRTIVLALQNGLGNIETLHRYLPKQQVLAGRVIFGVEKHKQGVKVTVSAEPTAIGETCEKKITPRVLRIVQELNTAGIPAQACRDIKMLLWRKVAYNCALNPLASLLNTHYGMLGEKAWTRKIMEAVIAEVYRVAKHKKVQMNPDTAQDYIREFYKTLLPKTYDHHPSMLQDLKAGRKTEIHALNGAVADMARQLGFKAPVNALLFRWIQTLEKRHSSRKISENSLKKSFRSVLAAGSL